MTVDIKAFASAVSAASAEQPKSAASARLANDASPWGSGTEDDLLPGSPDACFAALVAWLMHVAPPASAGDAAESVTGERVAGGTPTVVRQPIGAMNSPLVGNGAAAAHDVPTDALPFARAVLSITSTPYGASSDVVEPADAVLPAQQGDSSPRSAGPLDLSFLNVASAAAPAREVPAAPSTAAAEPRMQFASELGQRVVTMVEQGVHDARLRVHPEHLGPIEIRVRLDGDSAQVTFHSAHGAVREALADAVPRLRELLGAAGFGLDHVDIGAGDPQWAGTPDGHARDAGGAGRADVDSSTEVSVERDEPARAVAITHGLVDTFA